MAVVDGIIAAAQSAASGFASSAESSLSSAASAAQGQFNFNIPSFDFSDSSSPPTYDAGVPPVADSERLVHV